jgi:cephalosporin hydroxylase
VAGTSARIEWSGVTSLDAQAIGSVFSVHTSDGLRRVDAYSEEGAAILANLWTRAGWQQKISYEATWMGIPIIQLPEDILVLQELIWRTRPTVIVECGVAHGGALIFYASMLELLGCGRAIGVDIEIRPQNRLAIETHAMSGRVTLIEANSADAATGVQVGELVETSDQVMVMLDSKHTRAHVGAELELYSKFVTPGCYLVVFDGVMSLVHDAPNGQVTWSEDNPLTAVDEFLQHHPEFERDRSAERLGATYCTGGFLRRRVDS